MPSNKQCSLEKVLKNANIDIVGGENDFFDKLVKSVSYGKSTKKFIQSSDLQNNLLGSNGNLVEQLKALIKQFGIKSQDIKNLTIAALLAKIAGSAKKEEDKEKINHLLEVSKKSGLGETVAGWLIN